MARYHPLCIECHEPCAKEGDERCDWCLATPAERRRKMLRSGLLLAAAVALCCLGMYLAPGAK